VLTCLDDAALRRRRQPAPAASAISPNATVLRKSGRTPNSNRRDESNARAARAVRPMRQAAVLHIVTLLPRAGNKSATLPAPLSGHTSTNPKV
jgi:hypothetical protein